MAKRRKAKQTIDKKMIIEAFAEMAKQKNIDRDLLQGVMEETLSMIVRKKYGQESDFEIIVNMDKGDIEIYLMKEIVEEVEDEEVQISLKEVQKYTNDEEEYEIGDEFIDEITLDNLADNFGRRLVALASQNLNQRIRDIEKDNIFNEYDKKKNEIIVAEIHQIRRHDILVMHDQVEMRLPRDEQIPNESYKYKKAQTIKAIIKDVRRSGQSGQPDIILSRASESFLERLFEIEIPEIYDGIIQIKAIARDPGERSKVAVLSFDDRVDPVGACVGMKGIRIHSIVRELNNENIDLIEFTENPQVYINRALAPAKVRDIQINDETNTATVTLPEDQVSLAIGKNGQNVRLASRLTGYQITLVKEGAEDIDIKEFEQEIGVQLLADIQSFGINTAREFIDADIEELLELDDLSPELLIELRSIMLNEFDEDETDETFETLREIAKRELNDSQDGEEEETPEENTTEETPEENTTEETE